MEKLKHDDGVSEAVTGPFTVRDLTVGASALVIFVGSLIPYAAARGLYGNLWNSASLFFLGIGAILPIVLVALFVARRFSPRTRLHIGSLSVDQFASVVAVLATVFYFLASVTTFTLGFLISLLGALGLLAATVLGPHLPMFSGDFAGRAESPAHLVARPAVPARKKEPAAKPAEPKPAHTAGPKPAETKLAGLKQAGSKLAGSKLAGLKPAGSSQAEPKQAGPTAGETVQAETKPARTAAAGAGGPDTHAAGAHAAHAGTPTAVTPTLAAAAGSAAVSEKAEKAVAGVAPEQADAATTVQEKVEIPKAAGAGDGAKHAGPVTGQTTSISATRDAEQGAPAYEAFWFAVAQPREVLDESTGRPSFTVTPGAWILALEDRGEEFLVQNTDGRIGVLRDLRSIERA